MNKKSVLKQFAQAFNRQDVVLLSSLLDKECIAISSSGGKIVGQNQLVETYKQIMQKYGDNARYKVGYINNEVILLINHKVGNRWTLNAVKSVKIKNGKVIEIHSRTVDQAL